RSFEHVHSLPNQFFLKSTIKASAMGILFSHRDARRSGSRALKTGRWSLGGKRPPFRHRPSMPKKPVLSAIFMKLLTAGRSEALRAHCRDRGTFVKMKPDFLF